MSATSTVRISGLMTKRSNTAAKRPLMPSSKWDSVTGTRIAFHFEERRYQPFSIAGREALERSFRSAT
jgi:hypothetical protein